MESAIDMPGAWFSAAGNPVNISLRNGAVVATPRFGSVSGRGVLRGVRDWVVYASGKTVYYISKLVNQVFNGTAYSFPATLYFALWTTTLTSASTGSSGTECSYTGYARVAVTANSTNFSTSSAGSSITNNIAVTWPANTATSNTATYMAICDASSAGNMMYFGSISSTVIGVGDTPQMAASALTASEA